MAKKFPYTVLLTLKEFIIASNWGHNLSVKISEKVSLNFHKLATVTGQSEK